MIDSCQDCGVDLTDDEIDYYENRCEFCEIDHQRRLLLWLAGQPDVEMDQIYGVTIH